MHQQGDGVSRNRVSNLGQEGTLPTRVVQQGHCQVRSTGQEGFLPGQIKERVKKAFFLFMWMDQSGGVKRRGRGIVKVNLVVKTLLEPDTSNFIINILLLELNVSYCQETF